MAKNHKSKPARVNKNTARRYLKSFCFCCLLRQCGAGAGLLSNPGVRDRQCEGQADSQASHGEYVSHSKIIHIYGCLWCFKGMMVACESLAPCCLPDFEGWVSPSGSVCLRRCKLADKELFTVSRVLESGSALKRREPLEVWLWKKKWVMHISKRSLLKRVPSKWQLITFSPSRNAIWSEW